MPQVLQTAKDDFDEEKARELVWSGLGSGRHRVPSVGDARVGDELDLEVPSIGPWRMSSLVAFS